VKMTGMPSFGATHDDDEVWSIVGFIEKLPGMSAEQYRQLKQESFGGIREPMTHHRGGRQMTPSRVCQKVLAENKQ